MDAGTPQWLSDLFNRSVDKSERPRLFVGDGEVGSALEVLGRELTNLSGDRQPAGGELESQLGLMVVGVRPAGSASWHQDGDRACA